MPRSIAIQWRWRCFERTAPISLQERSETSRDHALAEKSHPRLVIRCSVTKSHNLLHICAWPSDSFGSPETTSSFGRCQVETGGQDRGVRGKTGGTGTVQNLCDADACANAAGGERSFERSASRFVNWPMLRST